ncbi:MAG: tail fiber domain-containing protein [Cellulophaga sp.]
MKKIVLVTLLLLCALHGFAQTEGISYQAVILNPDTKEIPGVNAQETILANSQVAIKFTIVDDLGNIEYEEYHSTSTDAYGMINLLIGGGSATGNTNFAEVFWDGYTKTLKVGIDFSGGSNYTVLGEQELTYMPQPPNQDMVAAIENNTNAVAAIAASITTDGGITDPATAENTLAIALNTAKTGITSGQASAITANTSKVGVTAAQETVLGNTSGSNSGDQDISGIATNATNIAANVSAIGINTAKTGITAGQASAIIANTAKVGVPSAYALPNTDGTSSQVLQTNGSGVLTWATPTTTTTATSYSGVLPVANGGTGSATQNFVDLTTNQTIAGNKIFSTNGSFNGTFIGIGNASGSSNTAVGRDALNGASTGHRNTAIGQSSMLNYVGTSFDNNTSVGYNNLVGLTTGSGNTSMGAESMMALQTGTSNTSIGNQSLINTTGNNNIGVGQRSGDILTTGSNNTIVGTRANVSVNNQTNATALGYEAVVTASNTIQLGNTSVTDVITSGKLTTGAITLPNTDGDANQVLQTNGSGVLSWSTPATVSLATFDTTGNVTSNSNGTIATDDFVFGSTSLDNIGGSTDNSRMFFDKSKAAFRVGSVSDNHWNTSNLGEYSIAMGANTRANGKHSTAMGHFSNASGKYSTAIGNSTTASGVSSTVMGLNTNSKSYAETVIGVYNTDYALAIDGATQFNVTDRLFIIGNGTGNTNRSDALVMLKNGNTTLKGQLTLTNGTDSYTLPNTDGTANQILQTNGSGVLSWSTPSTGSSSTFETTSGVTANSNGTITTDDFVFGSSTLDHNDADGIDNHGGDYLVSRMFFDKSKGAFRVGTTEGNNWNEGNVGNNSIAMGYNVKASNQYALAMGNSSKATGTSSIAIGELAYAREDLSLAIGRSTKAYGNSSTAIGFYTVAIGERSTAMGASTIAESYGETAIGIYNTTSVSKNATSIVATDRLFVIGNGTGNSNKSNALVMLKDATTTVSGNWSGPAFTATSDIRLKENITNLSLGMAVLNRINTKQYYLKKDATKQLRFGVIAQELREVLPNLVYGEEGENSYLSVNYTELIPILINALKEQGQKIDALEKQNQVLLQLVKRVDNLEKK